MKYNQLVILLFIFISMISCEQDPSLPQLLMIK